MPPIISKKERFLCYAIIVAIDILQFILDCFVITELANHFIDVAVGAAFVWYGLKRNLLTGHKALVLAATFFAEQIPFVNALPFWTYDLHNLYKNVATEETEEEVTGEGPANVDGVRRPSIRILPKNQDGVRLPENDNIIDVEFQSDDEDERMAA